MLKICTAIPSKRITPQDVFATCGADILFQEEKLGIKERYILEENETGLGLAQNALSELLQDNAIEKGKIEFLIYVTQTPENTLPQNSSLLQSMLDLPSTVCAFDISLGCSGYVYALSLARALMKSEGFQQGIIITCDCYSKIINPNDRATASIFGDAATATYLDNDVFIGYTDYGTDGSQGMKLCKTRNTSLFMDGRAIFNFMMTRVEPSIEKCLAKNQIERKNIDFYIFHQASKFLLETLITKLNLDSTKTPILLEKYGNTVSSSIPIALEHLLSQNTLQGKIFLLSAFGVGLSWATTILKIK